MSLADQRHKEIRSIHEDMVRMNKKLVLDNNFAAKLRRDFDHEKVVLEERKMVSKYFSYWVLHNSALIYP